MAFPMTQCGHKVIHSKKSISFARVDAAQRSAHPIWTRMDPDGSRLAGLSFQSVPRPANPSPGCFQETLFGSTNDWAMFLLPALSFSLSLSLHEGALSLNNFQ